MKNSFKADFYGFKKMFSFIEESTEIIPLGSGIGAFYKGKAAIDDEDVVEIAVSFGGYPLDDYYEEYGGEVSSSLKKLAAKSVNGGTLVVETDSEELMGYFKLFFEAAKE